MYKIIYNESYLKKAQKFFKKHPTLLTQYEKTLKLLELNPHHPSLRLHKLSRKLADLHSVSINISYRLVIYLLINDQKIMLIDIGSHNQVY
jgi:addiction module RelE/StbE family toxin